MSAGGHHFGDSRPSFWVWFAWQADKIPTGLWLAVIFLELLTIYLQNWA